MVANSPIVANESKVEKKEPVIVSQPEGKIFQLEIEIEKWKSDYYKLDLNNQELQQKLHHTYSLKFTEKAQQYLGDLVKKHVALTHKQHLYRQQESQERDFLDNWTSQWFFRDGGEEIFSSHE